MTTKTAARKSATQAPSGTVTELEVGGKGRRLLARLRTLRVDRLLVEREEKPLKDEFKELWAGAAEGMARGDVIVVKSKSETLGKVTLKKRAASVDLELLQQAFPEAYEKCVDADVHTPQFDPA